MWDWSDRDYCGRSSAFDNSFF
ncbi:hypothetical protein N7466_006691 [Penicillium verhagenii]|nr:hypothetical protein N7466_006691 [Penicillium verhagenii]